MVVNKVLFRTLVVVGNCGRPAVNKALFCMLLELVEDSWLTKYCSVLGCCKELWTIGG